MAFISHLYSNMFRVMRMALENDSTDFFRDHGLQRCGAKAFFKKRE